jgi:transposase
VQQYRSYRFEVRATAEQRAFLCRIAGSCRFVYNKALALQRIRVAGGHRRLSYAASCKALAAWKSDENFAPRFFLNLGESVTTREAVQRSKGDAFDRRLNSVGTSNPTGLVI